MPGHSQYEELARQLRGVGAVKRDLTRILPQDCSSGSAAVLALLRHHGEMRMSRLAELLSIDMSVTSRHVAHAADRGWLERQPDPLDKRSRLLSLSPAGSEVLREISERYVEMLATALDDWTDEDVDKLIELLARLHSSFGDCRTRGGRQLPQDLTSRTPA